MVGWLRKGVSPAIVGLNGKSDPVECRVALFSAPGEPLAHFQSGPGLRKRAAWVKVRALLSVFLFFSWVLEGAARETGPPFFVRVYPAVSAESLPAATCDSHRHNSSGAIALSRVFKFEFSIVNLQSDPS